MLNGLLTWKFESCNKPIFGLIEFLSYQRLPEKLKLAITKSN